MMSIARVSFFFSLVILVQISTLLYSGTYNEYVEDQDGGLGTRYMQHRVPTVSEVNCERSEFPTTKRYIYRVSTFNGLYKPEHTPKCWFPDCDRQNNYLAYRVNADRDAEEWNSLGVLSMEQYLQGTLERMGRLNNASLIDAVYYFAKGIQGNPGVSKLHLNLGLALIQKEDYENANKLIKYAISLLEAKSELAIAYLALGMSLELQGKSDEEVKSAYKMVYELDENVAKSYAGIPVVSKEKSRVSFKGEDKGIKTLRDMAIYKYFARHSISDHALFDVGTQDMFINNQYVYLRNILPPFVLTSYANYVHDLIKKKQIVFGDNQSKRYNMHNDRVSRFVHEQLTDLVRRVTAYSVKPSYTYFGGYVTGAVLKKHLDREQCEFTLSLSIERYPPDERWDLALNRRPIQSGDREAIENLEEEGLDTVTVDLKDGDGLLFMGRRLAHYRKGPLKDNQWLNQVFLHYVREEFNSALN